MHLVHLPRDVHLTYCTNIHAGESWNEVRHSLETHVPHIKAKVSPHNAFGLGLRLSGIAAEALSAPAVLDELRGFLDRENLYVFTINAFPYGPFHGRRVKEDVYQPDWLTPERLSYSDRAAEILAGLLPDGMVGSVSTVPGTFKAVAAARPEAASAMADALARHVATLVSLQRRTGREIVLALEPEPCCFLETVEETIAFFRDHLHTDASAAIVADQTGMPPAAAHDALRRHLGVCYDVCHGAVEFEEPARAFAQLGEAGIRIGKLQLSSALRAGRAGGEWRIHCHVPVFLEIAGGFHSTQPALKAALAAAKSTFVSPHLEVETYTWDVLPPELRQSSRADAIVREMLWVLKELS